MGILFGSAMIFIPVVSHIIVLGPPAARLFGGLEGAAPFGGASALVGALTALGIPRNSVLRYETTLKADKFMLAVHGDTRIYLVRRLCSTRPELCHSTGTYTRAERRWVLIPLGVSTWFKPRIRHRRFDFSQARRSMRSNRLQRSSVLHQACLASPCALPARHRSQPKRRNRHRPPGWPPVSVGTGNLLWPKLVTLAPTPTTRSSGVLFGSSFRLTGAKNVAIPLIQEEMP